MTVWLWMALVIMIPEGDCISALALGESLSANEISLVYSSQLNGFFLLTQLTF